MCPFSFHYLCSYVVIFHSSLAIGRLFKKIELNESIRYAAGDPIESWLHGLLCLDATNSVPKLSG